MMTEKELKGLKLISLSLVFGTLLDNKEHLWTKREQLLLGMIEKEHKGLILKVEGTLLGKIGTLMDEKGTKTLCKE